MRGVTRPAPGHEAHRPDGRSSSRAAGRWHGVRFGARVAGGIATAAAATLFSVFVISGPAAAAGQSDGTVSSGAAAASDPSFLGLGTAGLLWALVGLLAVMAGLFLATRRVRKPIADLTPTSSNDEPGGARR